MSRLGALACALGVAAGAGACTGTSGTVQLALTTAPGSTVLDAAQTLRLTITAPRTVTEATRASDGSFDLAIDIDATQTTGAVVVEGLDATGATIAVGESPPFPLSAISAKVVVYMAAPRSFGAAPLALDAARDGVTVVALPYGGVLAGGRDAAGAATDELHIYNAFDHTLAAGKALPLIRSDMTGALGTSGLVYLFGGRDGPGAATGTLWRFDPTQAPDGAYTDLGTHADLARAGQVALLVDTEEFVISGAPALDLAGVDGTLTARADLAMAPATAAGVLASDGVRTVVFAGAAAGGGGVTRLRNGVVDTLQVTGAARTDHAVVGLANGKVAIVGGLLAGAPTLDALVLDAATGTATTVTGALSTPRLAPTAVATRRYVVVAGGTDAAGAVISTADVLDATTLALVATVPMVVGRTGAAALALPNEQILFVGGRDATGAPSDLIELFTPDAPP